MRDVLTRLYHIARSHMPRPEEFWKKFASKQKTWPGGEQFRTSGSERASQGQSTGGTGQTASDENPFGVPPQVAEDLAAFGLVPPSSFEAVRKARNREIKKYHPDRFVNDPERLETAKQIMQIYNAAYDRLESYYEKRQ